jgi:hypothetical protein
VFSDPSEPPMANDIPNGIHDLSLTKPTIKHTNVDGSDLNYGSENNQLVPSETLL